MDYTISLLVCKDRVILQTLCADEDLENIITGYDEKVNVQEVRTIYLKLHDGTIKENSKCVISECVAITRAELQVYKGRSLVLQKLINKKNIYFEMVEQQK